MGRHHSSSKQFKKHMKNILMGLSVIYIIWALLNGYTTSILIFIIVSILTRFFTKKIRYILGIGLIVSWLSTLIISNKEGFSSTTSLSDNASISNPTVKKYDNTFLQNKNTNNKNMKKNKRSAQGLHMTNIDSDDLHNNNDTNTVNTDTMQGFELPSTKRSGNGGNQQIDYASTIENAYGELSSILGSEGMQKLTNDTKKLMEQQMKLTESMKGMEPIIKNITPMVGQLKGMLSQFTNI